MEILGEYIDRLITVEMRPRNFPQRGIIRQLYEEAVKKKMGRALTLCAAEKLMELVRKDDNVLITTGVGCKPFFIHGETDGPLGAASLARAISLGLGAKPIFVVGELDVEPVTATAKAAGINIEEYGVMRELRHTGSVITFPFGEVEGKQAARDIVEKCQPKAVISVEVLGPNSKGVIHGATGLPFSSAKLHHLFEEARSHGIFTIGCIDCGNELGSGSIVEGVKKIARFGEICQCPCGGGIACVTEADVTIPSACSNWGGYGIAAMLAVLLNSPEVLHSCDEERRMLEVNIMAGAVDGFSMRPIMAVDSISDKANQSLITLLQMLVKNGCQGGKFRREA
jgi:D-glutamate cyclase